MAVDLRYLTYTPQILNSSEIMNAIGSNGNVYDTPIGYGVPPLSGTTTDSLLQMYGYNINDSVPAKTAIKDDSVITFNLPVSRKRPRESINQLVSLPMVQNQNSHNNRGANYNFLGEDISLRIHQQQSEIDRFVSQHTEKVRRDIEERRKRNCRRIVAAVEEGIMSKLRAKEDEIDKIGKLNWALEEKVKSLCVENQIWRDLAQTNEATANVLRSNLDQLVTHFQDDERQRSAFIDDQVATADDAQSCCGSNYGGGDEEERYMIEGEKKAVKVNIHYYDEGIGATTNKNSNRWCRNCGKAESCVLVLPCRHLCLCNLCGSSLHTCPICKSTKEASLHVNLYP